MLLLLPGCQPSQRDDMAVPEDATRELRAIQELLNQHDVESLLQRLSPNFFLRTDLCWYPLDYAKASYPQRVDAFRQHCRHELDLATPVLAFEPLRRDANMLHVLWRVSDGTTFEMALIQDAGAWRISDFLRLAGAVQNHTYATGQ